MRVFALVTAVVLISMQLLVGGVLPAAAGEKGKGAELLSALTNDNTEFAFDMYNRVSADNPGKSVFFSPVSVSMALGMTYAGARGETEKQMATTMRFSLPQDKLHVAFAALSDQLKAAEGKGYQLNIANALWGQKNYPFAAEFLSMINKHYGGGFNAVDFAGDTEGSRQAVNRWVEGKTNDKIKDLLKQDDVNSLTRLVLTNAIYFKGDWAAKFKKEDTRTAPFYLRPDESVQAAMMCQSSRFGYADVGMAQILEMPYAGNELSMVVLLPRERVEEFGARLTPDLLGNWLSGLSEQQVAVTLPKFKFEARYGLADMLSAMGMPDAFDLPPADFSGITGGKHLYITKVIHQAVIEVNEEGSEAAAATAVIMGTKSAAPRVVEFTADRPFIFLIRHKATGTILFMGRVANPAAG